MNIDVNIFTKTLADWIQWCIKRIICYDLVGFISGMQGWFKVCISISHHIYKMKEKIIDQS